MKKEHWSRWVEDINKAEPPADRRSPRREQSADELVDLALNGSFVSDFLPYDGVRSSDRTSTNGWNHHDISGVEEIVSRALQVPPPAPSREHVGNNHKARTAINTRNSLDEARGLLRQWLNVDEIGWTVAAEDIETKVSRALAPAIGLERKDESGSYDLNGKHADDESRARRIRLKREEEHEIRRHGARGSDTRGSDEVSAKAGRNGRRRKSGVPEDLFRYEPSAAPPSNVSGRLESKTSHNAPKSSKSRSKEVQERIIREQAALERRKEREAAKLQMEAEARHAKELKALADAEAKLKAAAEAKIARESELREQRDRNLFKLQEVRRKRLLSRVIGVWRRVTVHTRTQLQEVLERKRWLKLRTAFTHLRDISLAARTRQDTALRKQRWRVLARTWRAWKTFSRQCQTEREAAQLEASRIKAKKADAHSRHRNLFANFSAWASATRQSRLAHEQEIESERRKALIAAALQTLAANNTKTDIIRTSNDRNVDKSMRTEGMGLLQSSNKNHNSKVEKSPEMPSSARRSEVSSKGRSTAPSSAASVSTNGHGEGSVMGERERSSVNHVDQQALERKAAHSRRQAAAMALRRRMQDEEKERKAQREADELEDVRRQRREKQEEETARIQMKHATAQAERELNRRAHNYRRHALILYCGWKPWLRLVKHTKYASERADRFHRYCVMIGVWDRWIFFKQVQQKRRLQHEEQQAEAIIRGRQLEVMRWVWGLWRKIHHRLKAAASAVVARQKNSLRRRTWGIWCKALPRAIRFNRKQWNHAMAVSNRSILTSILRKWRTAAIEGAELRVIEESEKVAWQKIRGWLGEKDKPT